MNSILRAGMMAHSVAVAAPDLDVEQLDQLILRYGGRRDVLNAIVCAADRAAGDEGRCLTDDDDAAARAVGALVDETLIEICRLPVRSLAAIQRKAAWLQQLDEAHGELQDRPDLLAAALASMVGMPGCGE